MSKKWLLVVGGIVLVAAVVVGGQMLVTRSSAPTPPGVSPGIGNAAGVTSGSVAASAGTSNGGGFTTTAGIVPAKGDESVGGANATLQPFPAMPDPHLPAHKVTEPAPPGQVLAPLSDAPGQTISALKLGSMSDGSAYTIRMRPYGIGPSSNLGSRLVIRVDTAAAGIHAPTSTKIANTNVIALVDTRHGGTVTRGGTYSAVLTFRSDGKRLLPVLSEVKATQ
jgi:hypothetical protein